MVACFKKAGTYFRARSNQTLLFYLLCISRQGYVIPYLCGNLELLTAHTHLLKPSSSRKTQDQYVMTASKFLTKLRSSHIEFRSFEQLRSSDRSFVFAEKL